MHILNKAEKDHQSAVLQNSLPTNGIDNPEQYTLKKRPWRRRTTPFTAILHHHYPGDGSKEHPFVITWLDNDAEDPMSFSLAFKWVVTLVNAVSALAVALASSTYSGAALDIRVQFRVRSQEVVILGISLFVLGFAFGPLLWGPLSEVYGRRILFITTYAMFTLWNGVAAASPNIGSYIVFRFLAGSFGSSPLANAGGTISDMFTAEMRGLAAGLFAAAPILGPAIGPCIGGFIAENVGWKWVQIVLACFSGAVTIVAFFVIPETYAPTILRQRAARLSRVTGESYKAPMDIGSKLDFAWFRTQLQRPWQLLFQEPIVMVISVYMAIVYGTLYMLFAAFPIVGLGAVSRLSSFTRPFEAISSPLQGGWPHEGLITDRPLFPQIFQEGRRWSAGISGLAFMGMFVGMLGGLLWALFITNPHYLKISKRNGGHVPPEARLPPSLLGGPALVIGLAWFSATCGPEVFWLVPIMAAAPVGFGMVLLFLPLTIYLIEVYSVYSASVLAASGILRSLFGVAFPLFTTPMYRNLGIHWASAVPGFLALACLPFPFLFYKYGAAIRSRCKWTVKAEKLRAAMSADDHNIAQPMRENDTHPDVSHHSSPAEKRERDVVRRRSGESEEPGVPLARQLTRNGEQPATVTIANLRPGDQYV